MNIPDLTQVLVNLSQSYGSIYKLLTAFCYVVGMSFSLRAVYALKVYGQLRTMMASNASISEPLMYMIVAAGLLFLPTAINTFMYTIYQTPHAERIQVLYGYGGATSAMRQYIAERAVLATIQLVGYIAFIRGWFILSKMAGHGGAAQGQTAGKALTHLIGGVMAINASATKDILWKTFTG